MPVLVHGRDGIGSIRVAIPGLPQFIFCRDLCCDRIPQTWVDYFSWRCGEILEGSSVRVELPVWAHSFRGNSLLRWKRQRVRAVLPVAVAPLAAMARSHLDRSGSRKLRSETGGNVTFRTHPQGPMPAG